MNEFAVVEDILRNRRDFFDEIREGVEIPAKIRAMLISSVLFLALYGAVLGSTHSLLQTISSALKLPILFLITLIICLPTLYFFNVLFGSRQSLSQSFALILTAITVTAVLLLSFAPITLFFMLTTSHYQFFKLLNVGIFAITGFVGVTFLYQGMQYISREDEEGKGARVRVLQLWILIYGFVGSQMAWTLRPFIGSPDLPFEPFRQLGGNFYVNIIASIAEILGFVIVK
jgi:hypothetical protein